MNLYRKCPICENDKVIKLKKIEMQLIDEINLPQAYEVVYCKNCGFCYANTNATKEDYDSYYTNCNVYSNMPKIIDKNNSRFYYFKEFIDEHFKHEDLLLNLGIGDGIFEIQASDNGYKNIIGIDPSEDSVEKLKKYGIQAYKGSIYNSEYKKYLKNKVSAIFLFDVLEHLLNLNLAINNLKEIVEEDTKVFITVPNCGEIDKNSTYIPNNFNQEHINYFSRQSLINIMSKFGFEEIFYCESVEEIYSIYNYNVKDVKYIMTKDENILNAMNTYFNEQHKTEIKRNEIIHKLNELKEPLIIWGTGAYTMNLLATTELIECNIKYFVDNNKLKSGTRLNNLEVKSPNEIIFNDEYTIAISSMLNSNDIYKQIKDLKLKNKIVIL